jgi:hypothetical protein
MCAGPSVAVMKQRVSFDALPKATHRDNELFLE